jgi:hypothetical protein
VHSFALQALGIKQVEEVKVITVKGLWALAALGITGLTVVPLLAEAYLTVR